VTELILHIGPHRTGSTAIQRYLYDSFATPKDGIWYPPFALSHYDGQPSHSALVWELVGQGPSHQHLDFEDRRDRAGPLELKAALAHLNPRETHTVILAAEDFSMVDAQVLQEFLPIPITRVVYTARRPDLHLRSLWRHFVRGGFARRFSEMVTDVGVPGWPHVSEKVGELNYRVGAQSWREAMPDAEFVAVIPGKSGVTRTMLMEALGLPDKYRDHDVDREANAGLSDVQTLYTLGALEVVARELGDEPTHDWYVIREAIVDVAFRRTMPDTSLHVRLDAESAAAAQALTDAQLDELFRNSDRIVGDRADAKSNFVELFVHPETAEGQLAYDEGRQFGEQLFSDTGQRVVPIAQSDLPNSEAGAVSSELADVQAQLAAESLELGVLKARVAQVEAQRDQMGRDLEIVRGWITDMQRSESLRIGKVLTAPGRLVKRFVP